MMMRIAWLMALCLPAVALAQIGETTRWADPSRVKLDVEFPGDGYHASWDLYRCACGDLLVRSELSAPGEVDTGDTLLVGGRAVLSRGFGEAQAELGASLDAPALMMQLALQLLERAEPGGPARITSVREIDLLEKDQPIQLETHSAVGGFQAPWSLKGRIAPVGDRQRRFDLHFEFMAGAGSEASQAGMRLEGQAWFEPAEFPVPGSTLLQDWRITWRDENDVAARDAPQARTLDDLRQLLD
jgi:hypothetical protein